MEHDIKARTGLEPCVGREGIIGSKVCKRFGFRLFRGVVKSFDPEVSWYCVKYEDSDQEEVDEDELREILVDADALSCLVALKNQSTALKRKSHPPDHGSDTTLDLPKGSVLASEPRRKRHLKKISNSFEGLAKRPKASFGNGFMKLSASLVPANSKPAVLPDEITVPTVVLSTDREPRGNHTHEQIFPFLIPKNQTARYSKRLKMEHRKPLEWPVIPIVSGKWMEGASTICPVDHAQRAWTLPKECIDILTRMQVDINVEELLGQEQVQKAKNIQKAYYDEWVKHEGIKREGLNHPQIIRHEFMADAANFSMEAAQMPAKAFEPVAIAKPVIGHAPGIPVNLHVQLWGELQCLGIHSPRNGKECVDILTYGSERGETLPLAVSLVVMRKNNRTRPNEVNEVVYRGGAGNDATGLGDGNVERRLSRSDEGLLNSHKLGTPIRLIQYIKDKKCVLNYRYLYKGLWWVVGAWTDLDSPRALKFRLVSALDRQLTSGQLKRIPRDHFICEDISFGMEAKKVSVVNNVDNSLPPGILQDSASERYLIGYEKDDSWFEYTHKYIHHPCVPLPQVPTLRPDTDPHALVERLNMCKPYVVRNSIKIPLLNQRRSILFECGPWCHCKFGKKCHYAVTERGIQFKLQVFRTQGKGWGLRTLEHIPAGAFVTTYTGLIIPQKDATVAVGASEYMFEMCRRTDMSNDNQYLDEHRSDIEVEYAVDAKHHGNVARFINHSCDPNVFVQPTLSTHLDVNMPKICLFASMDIFPGEELTYDYGVQFVMNYLKGQCLCGSVNCISLSSPQTHYRDDVVAGIPVPHYDKPVLPKLEPTMTTGLQSASQQDNCE